MGRKDTRKYKYFALQTLDLEGKPVIEKMKVEHCHNRCLEATIDDIIRIVALGRDPSDVDDERRPPLFSHPSDRPDDPYLSALHRDAWNRLGLKYRTLFCGDSDRAVTGEVVRLEITLWEISEEEYRVKEVSDEG